MQRVENLRTSEQVQPLDEPLIGPGNTYTTITDRISDVVLVPLFKTPRMWIIGALASALFLTIFLYCLAFLFATGVGIWGINIPVAWGFDIINFVWWIGIGHAGTLISAVLLLFRQRWRNSINRLAETMTLFAVACAGLYPVIHLGRVWLFHWLLPYPSTMGVWPQFRSPLVWDVFAVSTYGTVSLLFWYVGLIPDLATLRDRSRNRFVKIAYAILALGWRGASAHWQRYELASLILAAIATPLVVSVHSIVSLDFAVSVVPGWHVTIFPPYFVAGAIFSGFAMVLTLAIPIRKYYHLEDYITLQHLDVTAKVMLATGLIVVYGYATEAFLSIYSGNQYEQFMIKNRAFGPYGYTYWLLLLCNGAIPQLLWFRRFRRNIPLLFVISFVINIGMWLERFVIIVTSLARDYVPSSWGLYTPSIWDILTYAGSFGLFFTLTFLFIRVLPLINIYEMRHLLHEESHHNGHGSHDDTHQQTATSARVYSER